MRQLIFQSSPTAEQAGLMKSLLLKIFNLPRIGVSLVIFTITSVYLGGSLKAGEFVAPLLLFSVLLALMHAVLFLYILRRRPFFLESVRKTQDAGVRLIFTSDDFSVQYKEGSALKLQYSDVRGQYWCGDLYLLLVEAKGCREFFCIPVTEETFDDLYMLANILQKNKRKLIRLHVKTNKALTPFSKKKG